MAQQALAHGGNHDRVGDALPLNHMDEGFFVELVEEKNGSTQVKKSHGRLTSGVEVKRQGQKAALFVIESLADGVVERAERIRVVVDDTSLGEAGGPRGD